MNNKEKMFFFSCNEKDDKIVVGEGTDGDHFNVCMSTLALLTNVDGSNQNHVTCTGIDATCVWIILYVFEDQYFFVVQLLWIWLIVIIY